MLTTYELFSFISLIATVAPSPLNAQHQARANWYPPYSSCFNCFLSSWTQGPECATDASLVKTISRVLSPPASATATYTPTQWCSDFLRQTSWKTDSTTSSGISTYTDWTETHLFVTKTDLAHPTSTMYCPIPSAGMECGWDTNTIAPAEQGEDWSIEHGYNPTECQQICLEHSGCKAYRIDGSDASGYHCEIFNVGLGVNGTNLISPTAKGTQWWDRDCQAHIPVRITRFHTHTKELVFIEQYSTPTHSPYLKGFLGLCYTQKEGLLNR
ncbi:hypothetical protein K491DRAFT_211776 [Lophiostoma macrostomum CBS 122681]|uniref:Apple domain-containing protein n=1 Tax=Lophiostoma macrostomum CBS 122681 TaxID=1314788 RepID=A0A6A6SNF0_9PLEO|nr:hypothetical protein K491DRAFT_211776 [Lophiostoma macrostomum CBS 122681]